MAAAQSPVVDYTSLPSLSSSLLRSKLLCVSLVVVAKDPQDHQYRLHINTVHMCRG